MAPLSPSSVQMTRRHDPESRPSGAIAGLRSTSAKTSGSAVDMFILTGLMIVRALRFRRSGVRGQRGPISSGLQPVGDTVVPEAELRTKAHIGRRTVKRLDTQRKILLRNVQRPFREDTTEHRTR